MYKKANVPRNIVFYISQYVGFYRHKIRSDLDRSKKLFSYK